MSDMKDSLLLTKFIFIINIILMKQNEKDCLLSFGVSQFNQKLIYICQLYNLAIYNWSILLTKRKEKN